MRPTIPLADWRLAVDLGATRAIAAVPGRPAVGCPCPWCRNWRAVYARVLPSELREALERVGVVLAQPTDLYPSSPALAERVGYRVTYHAVGRILCGPPARVDLARFPGTRHYTPLRPAPDWLTLSVAYQREVWSLPEWATPAMAPLVQIDFRLWVPWGLDELRPPITDPVPLPRAPREGAAARSQGTGRDARRRS